MTVKRRQVLLFLSASAGATALGSVVQTADRFSLPFPTDRATAASFPNSLPFKPIAGPMPLENDGISPDRQIQAYSTYEVKDDVVLPEGFSYDVFISWGDRVGKSHFGYNNDYLSLIEVKPNEGFLVVNHEYISAKPWTQTYEEVIGKKLPFEEVRKAIKATGEKKSIDAFSLPDSDPLKAQIKVISEAALADAGISVISVRRQEDGTWKRTFENVDRRISGISGLKDGRYLKATGPAVAIFTKSNKQGYEDKLGDRIIGTHQNCAGGTTPWGTVLSAEENFQGEVTEAVYADGSAFSPSTTPFFWETEEGTIEDIAGQGNALGLAGNKYGWIVEIDPANPNDYGTKHTWLGRFRHEAVGVRVVEGKPLAFYSGCDRRSGHLYKFISKDIVSDSQDKANSRLLEDGMLYAAKFNPDGTGSWIALKPDTPIDPDLPSNIAGNLINLPKRPEGGIFQAKTDAEVVAFKQQFKSLGDLYEGNDIEKQGAILIDAHYAANAVGATCGARPEDTDVAADGSLYIAYTSGSPSDGDGGPDNRIFQGPNGETPYEHGWIMHLTEENNELDAIAFKWEILALGGEPTEGGRGFSNPDNLTFDRDGNLWMLTDISTDKQNKAIPSRTDKEGKPVSQSNLRGLFGNNSIWFIPTSGENVGNAYLFGLCPIDGEVCGPNFTSDRQALFLSIQHPGEFSGVRRDMAGEERIFAMKTTDDREFSQIRQVPIGSNWPGNQPNDPPKPSVIIVRRSDGNRF
jgi:hypothetical protein